MEAIYTALVNGQPEYKENGTYVMHPPSSLQLQAARALKQFSEITQQNQHVINQLQEQVNHHLFTIQLLNEQINELLKRTPTVPEHSTTSANIPDTGTTSSNT